MRPMPPPLLLVVLLGLAGCDPEPTLHLGLSVEEHTKAYFPIGDGDIHAVGFAADNDNNQPISCDACHAGRNSFAETVCIKCHQNDVVPLARTHAPVAGFQMIDSVCYGCHPDGKRGAQIGVDAHSELFFPISAGDKHGDDDTLYLSRTSTQRDRCAACHASVDDRTENLCAECHVQDSAPTLAEGHAADFIRPLFQAGQDSTSCKSCHAETPLPPAMDEELHQGIFPMDHHAAESPSGGIDCINCHDTNKLDPQAWAIEFGVANCVGCHTHNANCTLSTQGPCLEGL